MRRGMPLLGPLLVAVAMVISSCASSGSAQRAAGSGSAVAGSSPAAGSTSAVQQRPPAAACPADAEWPTGSTAPRQTGQLFVAGAPTLATLCHYVLFNADGSGLPPPMLVQISGAALTNLVRSLNALVPTNDEPPCPGPNQADVLTFAGAGSLSTVRADVQGGCEFVWSDTGLHAYATNELQQQLAAILVGTAGLPSPGGTIAVTPAAGLTSGQTVQVAVAGFHPEAKVWLSECATVADVDAFGCGTQLAQLPFLMTDAGGHATGSFTVTADIPTTTGGGRTQTCATCVLAAVSGAAPDIPPTPTATTPLTFPPTISTDS